MGMGTGPGVIWTRRVDDERQRRRTRRVVRFYLLPGVAALIAMAVFSGPAEALGLLIVLALAGTLIVGIPWMQNRIERANATITLTGGRLSCGRTSVALDEVDTYTTYHWIGGPETMDRSDGGIARFGLRDGREAEFYWPAMPPAEIDTVRAALDPHLPGRWRQRGA